MNIITIKDTSGLLREIDADEIIREVINSRSPSTSFIFGMPLSAILELRKEYLMIGGKHPITPESVKETFASFKK